MYKETNKTALKSQKRILEALFELMEQEEYNNITVKNICKKADISRQTFYYSLLKIAKQFNCCEMFICCREMLYKNLPKHRPTKEIPLRIFELEALPVLIIPLHVPVP